MTDKQVIAAFDFDGTLTTRDSLLPFLIFIKGYWLTAALLTLELPWLIGYLFGWVARRRTKERILRRFFGGEKIQTLRTWGEEFAHSHSLSQLLNPQAMERLRWHQRQGHRCIIVSASIDIYLYPWIAIHHIKDLVSSRLEVSPDKKVEGRLIGLNCWGPEKTRRLTELVGPKNEYVLYAYGDSRGDKELLEMADYPYLGRFS
jgi:HAD superfamily hydrolase (TIGR01490 family)